VQLIVELDDATSQDDLARILSLLATCRPLGVRSAVVTDAAGPAGTAP
jgi:hypothetical protein